MVAEKYAKEKFSSIADLYQFSVTEDNSGNNPSNRMFRVQFSNPTRDSPVDAVTASLYVYVRAEGTKYIIGGYRIEGRRQIYDEDFPFNKQWVEKVIKDKLLMRKVINTNDNSEFLKTRLQVEEKE
tara:strand:+ start:587 stop:964 length:378 start_codon:yes stop_codon:yes gene_type:complete